MELGIVWSVDDMAKFVEHRVGDLLDGQKLGAIARMTQPQENLLSPIDIQP